MRIAFPGAKRHLVFIAICVAKMNAKNLVDTH